MYKYKPGCIAKAYEGKLTIRNNHIVTINGTPLDCRQDIVDIASDLSWGYGGAGNSQLAVAIMADAFSDELAKKWFCALEPILKKFPQDKDWVMTEFDLQWILYKFSIEERKPDFIEKINAFYKK